MPCDLRQEREEVFARVIGRYQPPCLYVGVVFTFHGIIVIIQNTLCDVAYANAVFQRCLSYRFFITLKIQTYDLLVIQLMRLLFVSSPLIAKKIRSWLHHGRIFLFYWISKLSENALKIFSKNFEISYCDSITNML